MTVKDLRSMLESYPDDMKVVLDQSTDYEEWNEATSVTALHYGTSICGGFVDWKNGVKNAVTIR